MSFHDSLSVLAALQDEQSPRHREEGGEKYPKQLAKESQIGPTVFDKALGMQDQEGAPEEGEEKDVMQNYSCNRGDLKKYVKSWLNNKCLDWIANIWTTNRLGWSELGKC